MGNVHTSQHVAFHRFLLGHGGPIYALEQTLHILQNCNYFAGYYLARSSNPKSILKYHKRALIRYNIWPQCAHLHDNNYLVPHTDHQSVA